MQAPRLVKRFLWLAVLDISTAASRLTFVVRSEEFRNERVTLLLLKGLRLFCELERE